MAAANAISPPQAVEKVSWPDQIRPAIPVWVFMASNVGGLAIAKSDLI